MQKWEYLTIGSKVIDDNWHVTYANDISFPKEKAPVLIKYINELGEQGWELVSETFTTARGGSFQILDNWIENSKMIKQIENVSSEYLKQGMRVEFFTDKDRWLLWARTEFRTLRFKRQKQ